MRLFGWFRFPAVARALTPRRRNKLRRRSGPGWHSACGPVAAVECLETRWMLAITLSVSNPAPFTEGDSGTSNMLFVVTRSGDTSPDVKVNYTTVDGTAKAGTDYLATSGTLDFTSGVTQLTVSVPVVGNTIFQPNRSFTLALSNASESTGPLGFAAPQTFSTGTSPVDVTAADINGDGRTDLIVANRDSNSVSVLVNTTPSGTTTASFAAQQTFATGASPRAVTVADLNGDGRADLIVANTNASTVSVLLNKTTPGATTANFTAQQTFAAGGSPLKAAAVDINGDGRPDLVFPDSSGSTVSVLLNTTAAGATLASFSPRQSLAIGGIPAAVAFADINGDGRKDLLVANYSSNSISVLLNTTAPGATTASFAAQQTFAAGSGPRAMATADINGDGLADLVVGDQPSNGVSVLLNTTAPGASQPSFAAPQTFATGNVPYSVTAVDVNGDGKPDILVSAKLGGPSAAVLTNITTAGSTMAAFAAASAFPSGSYAQGAAAADVNGDGKIDLVVANGSANDLAVMLNTTVLLTSTTINLPVAGTFAIPAQSDSVQVADFNGDGKPDLVVNSRTLNEIAVLLNTTAPGATVPSFTPEQTFATVAGAFSVAVADLNGDGLPDLVVGSALGNSQAVSVLLNTTTPGSTLASFAAQQPLNVGAFDPSSVAIADVNGDGLPDILAADYNSNTVSVLLNQTLPGASLVNYALAQTFATGTKPYTVTAADLNGDGLKDLIVSNYSSNTVSVLLNTTAPGATTASFKAQQTFAAGSKPAGLATADLNADGRQDIVVTDKASNSISLLLNTTTVGSTTANFNGPFTFAAGTNPTSVAAVDLNDDGKPDILVANADAAGATVLLNATISLVPAITFTAGGASFCATAADINGDGSVDVIVDNQTANTLTVMLNTPVQIIGSPATGTIQDDDAPVTVTTLAGTTPQSATVNSAYGTNLAVLVKNAAGDPAANVKVTFTAPGAGASGAFGGVAAVTIVTNSSGIATAPAFIANGTTGGYTVTAAAAGGANPSASFSLTNLAVPPAPLFTSATSTIFAVGLPGSFTVKASGTPAPTLTESNTDVLPAGVTFNTATGVLAGTPAAGTNGDYTLHFTASNGVLPKATQTFTLKVTSQFSFAGEYAVFSGSGSPTLASIAQNGNALTLTGASTKNATITNATQILVNGADTAVYGNSSITFATGTFAGQTWTKLDLPPDYTNQQGAATHVIENGSSFTFVNKFGTTSPATWTTPTQLFVTDWGESVTIGVGTLLWDDGSLWSENLHLTGNQNGSGTTTISAAPSALFDFDYVNGNGKGVHLIQTGTSQVVLIFANQVMGVGTAINATQLTCPACPNDIATISNDFTTVTWQDGTVWTGTAPTGAITVNNYTNQLGVAVHLIQNGSPQVAFVDSLGRVSLGTMTGANTAVADLYPGDVATIGANTVTWQDGFVWTKTNGPTPLTTNLVNANGGFSHVRLTSATTMLGLDGPLQGLTGTRVNNEIEWSNGDVWANFDYNALNALFEMATGYP